MAEFLLQEGHMIDLQHLDEALGLLVAQDSNWFDELLSLYLS
jgi:hypothetical protein